MSKVKMGSLSLIERVFSGASFKSIYLVLTFLSFNSFIFYRPFMVYFAWAVALLGSLNLLFRFTHYKNYVKTPGLVFVLLFLLSAFLTFLINTKYDNSYESLQGLTWTGLQLLILYAVSDKQNVGETEKELKIISVIFVSYTAIICFAGLIMLAANYKESFEFAGRAVRRGFIGGRLWGMYTDPNYGAISTTVGLMFSIHFFRKIRRPFVRVLLVFTGIVFVVHIIFSASRGGYIALFVAIAVYAISSVFILKSAGEKKKIIIRLIYVTGIVFGLLLLLILVAFLTRNIFLKITQSQTSDNRVWIWYYKQKLEQTGLRELLPQGKDFSNGRIKIWKSSVEFFKAAPLFGVDFRNIRLAAPDTVIESFGVGAGQLKFNAFHNLFIDVLVSQGAIGFLIFVAFTLFCLMTLIRLYFRMKAESADVKMLFALLVSILAACLASSMFLSDILYVNTQNSVIFWILLGYAMRLASIYTKKDDKLE